MLQSTRPTHQLVWRGNSRRAFFGSILCHRNPARKQAFPGCLNAQAPSFCPNLHLFCGLPARREIDGACGQGRERRHVVCCVVCPFKCKRINKSLQKAYPIQCGSKRLSRILSIRHLGASGRSQQSAELPIAPRASLRKRIAE